jgi:hypothetical protein
MPEEGTRALPSATHWRPAPTSAAAARSAVATASDMSSGGGEAGGKRYGFARDGVQTGRLGFRAQPFGVCQEDDGTLTQLCG